MIINHLRLRTGWLKIEAWMKMGHLLGGGEVEEWVPSCDDVKDGCRVVDEVWIERCHLKNAVVAVEFVKKRRKYTFCMENYYLELFLGGLFEILHRCRHYCLKANRNPDFVFHFRTHSFRLIS